MRTKRIAYFILMYLPLVVALIALPFLPDKIPAHYGFDNQVTRWGSKFEALLYPAVTIMMGYFLLVMGKWAAKQEGQGNNNENVILVTGILMLILFNVLNGYSLYTDFHKVENLSAVPVDLNQMIFGVFGVLMVVTGNIMPKVRLNSIVGLRTRWSMKNEAVWKKCQRFGGISFIIAGIVMIGICIAVKGTVCLMLAMAVLVVTAVIGVVASYQIARGN